MGFAPESHDIHDWFESSTGQDYASTFETARRVDKSGSYSYVRSKSGIPMQDGFPRLPVDEEVRIEPTNDRDLDIAAANRAAGYPETPEGFTWHHSERYGIMQLVPRWLHWKTGHWGGWFIWGKR